MALIKIKQINNTPASAGDVITFDGSINVWAPVPSSGLTIITSFANLPVSPSTNDLVFYTPFQSIMTFDGTDWVSPKIIEPMFGRGGSSTASSYLRGIAKFQTGPRDGISHGLLMPTVGGGSDYKIYSVASGNLGSISGTLELHTNSSLASPVFGTTGVGSVLTYTAQLTSELDFTTPAVVTSGSLLQCFFRRTNGRWREWNVTITYSLIAA